jgi:multidrug efflux pump
LGIGWSRPDATIYGQANQYRVVLEVDPRNRTDPSALAALRLPGVNASQILTTTNVIPTASGSALCWRARSPGEAAEFRASLTGQPLLILAAVIAIYIVLGVLYESYVHPLTILSTLPSAGIGALLALLAVGQHLTVIGVILLMGIVKKNAIMMIDFAIDAERDRGLSPETAIVEACRLRFRPIVMTTLAALLGALPLAMAKGAGAELRVPLGVSIIRGLLLSHVLTLYTTSVIYLALDGIRWRVVNWVRRTWERVGREPRRAMRSPACCHHAAVARAPAHRLRELPRPAGREHAHGRSADDARLRQSSRPSARSG